MSLNVQVGTMKASDTAIVSIIWRIFFGFDLQPRTSAILFTLVNGRRLGE